MKEIKILYLYPDILDLYGDIGNIKVLEYRTKKRGFSCQIDTYSIGDTTPNFSEYDKSFLVAVQIMSKKFFQKI